MPRSSLKCNGRSGLILPLLISFITSMLSSFASPRNTGILRGLISLCSSKIAILRRAVLITLLRLSPLLKLLDGTTSQSWPSGVKPIIDSSPLKAFSLSSPNWIGILVGNFLIALSKSSDLGVFCLSIPRCRSLDTVLTALGSKSTIPIEFVFAALSAEL